MRGARAPTGTGPGRSRVILLTYVLATVELTCLFMQFSVVPVSTHWAACPARLLPHSEHTHALHFCTPTTRHSNSRAHPARHTLPPPPKCPTATWYLEAPLGQGAGACVQNAQSYSVDSALGHKLLGPTQLLLAGCEL